MKEAEYKELIYEPPPFVHESFWAEFNALVPDVPDSPGTKRLRWIWGMDVLEYCAGFWERRYGDTDHKPVKYIGRARWVLEGYQPPSIYNRTEWAKDEHLLGPFPENGTWDFVAFHTDNQGGYLPLDESAINHVRIWAHWQGKGKKRSVEELLAAKHALWHQRHVEREAAKEKVALEFGERVVKHLQTARDVVSTSGPGPNFARSPGGILIPNN